MEASQLCSHNWYFLSICINLLYRCPQNFNLPFFESSWMNRIPCFHNNSQQRPPVVFCEKRCSWKFRKTHRKTPVSESLFNTVAGLRPATLLKKRFWHRYVPENFAKFLRTPFLQNTSWQLLLNWLILREQSVIALKSISLTLYALFLSANTYSCMTGKMIIS